MTGKGRTKDESFMVKLYEEASKQENIHDPLDCYVIGNLVGLQYRAVNAICHLLLRSNFIKKQGDSEVSITPHGINLVKSLIDKY